MTERRETELEMAQRHVREDENRFARQMDIVANLERSMALAQSVLNNMRVTLDMARRHLQAIEKRSKR